MHKCEIKHKMNGNNASQLMYIQQRSHTAVAEAIVQAENKLDTLVFEHQFDLHNYQKPSKQSSAPIEAIIT